MKTWLIAILTALVIAATVPAWAQGDAARGEQKATTCGACHGPDGNSDTPEWPKLAGIDAPYIVAQLHAYQSGKRQDRLMTPKAKPLTEEDIQDLAAYFASKKMGTNTPTAADKTLYEPGERIYKAGVTGTKVTACMVCHGPAGSGHPAVGFTRLAGQNATYLVNQLKAFRSKDRTDPDHMMPDVTAQMTDDDILAVSSYISTLPATP